MSLTETLTKKHLDTGEAPLSAALAARGKKLSDEKAVAEIVKDLVHTSERAKEQYWHFAWLCSFYFFMGHQQINLSRRHKRFYPAPVTGDRRMSVNLIQSRVLTIAAQEVSTKPTWETLPAGNDALAKEQARVSLDILRAIWHQSDFLAKRVMGAMYRALFGIYFMTPYWDPMKRIRPPEPIPVPGLDGPMEGQYMKDGRGKIAMTKAQGIGDIDIDLVSPFEAHFPPSTSLPIHSAYTWAATKRHRPTSEIYSKWKKVVKPEANALDVTSQVQWELGNFFEEGRTQFSEARAKDAAAVITYMEPPSMFDGFERGIVVKVAGEKMLEDPKPSLLREGRIALFPFPLIPVPLTPWGTTPALNMREPQMAFNKHSAMLSMMAQQQGMPHLQGEEGSIPEEHITEGNRIWLREQGTAPLDVIEFPRLNQANIGAIQQARENVSQAGGIGAYSMGQPLGSSPQPVGTIQLMQEADVGDLTLGTIISTDSMGKVGESILDIAREKYDARRAFYVVEENEDPRVLLGSKRDIPEGLKVRVQEASALPHIKEAQQQKILQMASTGVLAPVLQQNPGYLKDLLEIFDMPTPDFLETMYDVHKKKQERELRQMLTPSPPPNEPFSMAPLGEREDDAAHLEVLDRFINSIGFETLPPQAQQPILQHAQAHAQKLQAQQEAALKQQIMMQRMLQGGGNAQQGEAEGP